MIETITAGVIVLLGFLLPLFTLAAVLIASVWTLLEEPAKLGDTNNGNS